MSSALLQAVPTAPSSPPAFVSPTLVGGALPQAPEAELATLVEDQLVRLNACEARLDLELAAALAGIAMRDVHLLGHGTREDFARERLGCSWSHVRELLALENGLRELPRLREAFLHGALRRARLREILRVASPETEADWLLLARSLTSSELTARVRATLGRLDEKPPPDAHRFSVRVTPDEAVFIESIGLPMLRAVVGKEGPKHELMAALAAEVLAERGHEPLDAPRPRRGSCKPWNGEIPRPLLARPGKEPDIAWPVARGTDVESRLDHAQVLVQWRQSIDAQRASLLALFHDRGWHRFRGHPGFTDWLDRRLGLAPREAVVLERVAEAVATLPELAEAWRTGRIATLTVDKVSRVATPETAADWVRYVVRATTKRLDVELAAHAALRVHLGDQGWLDATEGGRPLWERSVAELRIQWAEVFAPKAADAPPERPGGSCNFPEKTRRGGPSRSAMPGRFGFDAPPDVLAELRQAMNRVHAESGRALDPAGCLIEMFWRFAATHVTPGLQSRTLRDKILRRDGWQCCMPHCRNRRNLEVHHVVYRSRGGSNEKRNLVTACRSCHRLEHLGKLHAMYEGIRQTRGGVAPVLVVRVGDRALSRSQHTYREGLRWSSVTDPRREPPILVASW